MKIHFDGVLSQGVQTGPGCFAKRLSAAFQSMGHSVIFHDGSDCDISLVFIERSGVKLASKIVQRLDGIWFAPDEFYTKNSKILGLYGKADGIIFQSQFDKNFIQKHWDLHRNSTVIHNGIASNPVTKFTSSALEDIRNRYKKIFVSSANWHPQKRLRDNINLFKHIQNNIEPSSGLIVLGNSPDVRVPGKDIYYTGSLPESLCLEVYSMADWMLCLEYLSHCPNVVIECLSQETPVICSSVGGAVELVQNFGIKLDEKEAYNYELVDYNNPPSIDVKMLTQLPPKNELGLCPKHDIATTAQNYIDFFSKL